MYEARGQSAANAAPLPTLQSPLYRQCLGAELAGLAEPPKVARHDNFHRRRVDAQSLEGAALALRFGRDDVVALQQPQLVEGERRFRHPLAENRHEAGE